MEKAHTVSDTQLEAEWIERKSNYDDYLLNLYCSNCHNEAIERPIDYDDAEYVYSPYCPSCGARMRNGWKEVK